MSAAPSVDILLATYNGAAFVAEQIESIRGQTHDHWRVLARDDGSSDGTAGILERYAREWPDRFHLISDTDGNLGYSGNFSRLLEHTTADYVALCDQDDIWLPDKLDRCIKALAELERAHGPTTPLLVHSDLRVVDRELNEISPSFWAYRGLDPRSGNDLNRVLAQNVATGCATVFNRSLRDVCTPIPDRAAAHDWWVALTATTLGATAHIAEPTVLYRQHGGNTIGARSFQPRHLAARTIEAFRDLRDHQRRMRRVFGQAEAFLEAHAGRVSAEQAALLRDFIAFPAASLPRRVYYTLKWRIVPPRRFYWLALALSI